MIFSIQKFFWSILWCTTKVLMINNKELNQKTTCIFYIFLLPLLGKSKLHVVVKLGL
jgi:hypothetical protein